MMIPKILFRSSMALLFASAPLYGQESEPASSGEGSLSGASSLETTATTTTETTTLVETSGMVSEQEPEAASFFFPGGYGYLPEVIAPGAGIYARPPIDFFATVQAGYSDNIYNREHDVKGSPTSQASMGLNYLLRTPRSFLSFGGSAGAIYYWDKERNQFAPVGSLNAAFAHSFTPRLQLTGRVNGGYYNQPNLSMPNAPTDNASGDYFNLNTLFDLSYRWTPLFSTVTTLGAGTQIFRDNENANYVDLSLGQAFRFLLAPRLTGVAEVRASTINYKFSDRNSDTVSVMAGFDWMITPRLSSTFRGGASFRQFDLPGAEDAASPYFESVLGYRYGRGSLLQWTTRFGFEEARDAYRRTQTFRTGLTVSQVFTPRINGSIGVSYAYENNKDMVIDDQERAQQLITGNARIEFIATRSLTLFGNYSRSQNISDYENFDYVRNEFSVGATFHF